MNEEVKTYISITEQSFDDWVVVSGDSFGFEHQVEADVRTITEKREALKIKTWRARPLHSFETTLLT